MRDDLEACGEVPKETDNLSPFLGDDSCSLDAFKGDDEDDATMGEDEILSLESLRDAIADE